MITIIRRQVFLAAFLLQASRSLSEALQTDVIFDNSLDAPAYPEIIYLHSSSLFVRLHCVIKSSNVPEGVTVSWERSLGKGRYVPVKTTTQGNLYPLHDLILTIYRNSTGTYKCLAMENNLPSGQSQTAMIAFALDGQWGSWEPWQCICSSQTRKRSRLCNNPKPSSYGNPCPGSSSETSFVACSVQDCRYELTRSAPKATPPSQHHASQNNSDPSNLVIVVAVCSALIGLLLCVAIIACWRRLHVEQRQARQRQEEENATRAMLLSMTDYDSGISADDYPDDPLLRQMTGPVPLGVSFPHAPASFAEALQGPAPPPNPFFGNPTPPPAEERNNQMAIDANIDGEGESPPAPDEEYAHLKEGMTEDEMPLAESGGGGDDDVPPVAIL